MANKRIKAGKEGNTPTSFCLGDNLLYCFPSYSGRGAHRGLCFHFIISKILHLKFLGSIFHQCFFFMSWCLSHIHD